MANESMDFEDNENALALSENGTWSEIPVKNDEQLLRAQEVLYKKYKRRSESSVKTPKIEFEVRRKD